MNRPCRRVPSSRTIASAAYSRDVAAEDELPRLRAALQPEDRVERLQDRRLRSARAVDEARAGRLARARRTGRVAGPRARLGEPPDMGRLDQRQERIRRQVLL